MAGTVSRLDPCDFFLWVYLEDRVFANHTDTIAELKTKIRSAIASISVDTFQKVVKTRNSVYAFFCAREVAISKMCLTKLKL